MAEFKEILDNLDADTMLSIFMRTLPKENNEDLRRFINTNQKVNALFSCLEEKKIKEIADNDEEMEREAVTTIRTIVFTLYELHKLDKNLDFKREMNM